MSRKNFWLLFSILFLIPSSLLGQSIDEESFEDLVQQIREISDRLEAKENGEKSLRETKEFQDQRVRDVGSQIIRRQPKEVDDVSLQIRLYDLSDLFAVSPNYPATLPQEVEYGERVFASSSGQHVGGGGFGGGGSGQGGGGGGVFNIAPEPIRYSHPRRKESMQAAQVTLSQLVETIKETVKPQMWGTTNESARIKFLGNTLLITATDDMHVQINNLLNLFREHWGKRRTISVQTYWIQTDHGAAADLLDNESNKDIGAGVVKEEKWSEFFSQARTEGKVVYSATLTGHNNQTLHALSGKQLQLTVGAKPFRRASAEFSGDDLNRLKDFDKDNRNPFGGDEEDESPPKDINILKKSRQIHGFQPLFANFHDGAAIEITPLATRGGNFVILDMKAKLNELISKDGENDNKEIFLDSESKRLSIKLDPFDFIGCRFNSTLRCPKGQVVLAGSMTHDPSSRKENPEIYIFVKAMVHTIEEDQSDRAQIVKDEVTEK